MIKLLRVDHRLIHGQVALTWTNKIGADCILVANDEIVNDPIQKTTLKLAAPHNVKVVIKNIEDSIEAIESGKTNKYKLLIVVKNIEDAHRLVSSVNEIKEVNIGGVKETPGSKALTHSVFVTPKEKSELKEMIEEGHFVYAQQVPTDSKIDLKEHL
ncbi:PTS sugar transporter subunit IIB [Enterococcus faecium]|uniref:PTS sugar transporter subunit IIB n=1 Tax=Enterococcus faecium TaxID=1352 RepID=UPI002954AEC5|nr:PTS sugar transporter subunit IIB [Enterococcus faecium]MDV7748255.1 PTS sugar transporter subunit IIB [Enterococcus faecium]MDW3703050.1 PTS sugar transporter subunit IIB [Enterococcus faecium]